jgi:hypothetical protein
MLDAFERFTNQNPDSSVKLLKIAIFQQSMVDSFRKRAFKMASGNKWWQSSLPSLRSMWSGVKSAFTGKFLPMQIL